MSNKRDVPIVLTSIHTKIIMKVNLQNVEQLFTHCLSLQRHIYRPVISGQVITKEKLISLLILKSHLENRDHSYSEPATADFDDDFGFNETSSFFQDAKTYNPTTGQDE